MYYCYMVECADTTLYTGITTNLERRLKEHNQEKRGAKYTLSRRPVTLVYFAKFTNRSLAAKEECRIKRLTKAEKMDLL